MYLLATLLVAVVALCFIPAIIAAAVLLPKTAAGLGLGALFPLLLAGSVNQGGGYAGAALDEAAFQRTVLDTVASFKDDVGELKRVANTQARIISDLQRQRIGSIAGGSGPRRKGTVSDDCARNLAASLIIHCERCGKLDALLPNASMRGAFLTEAREFAGVTRTAESSTELPLPTAYSGELLELIEEFGVARKAMTHYPMTSGINKPPRFGDRPAFGSIAMSQPFDEKRPTFGFASLEPHKIGGIIIVPREIQDLSIVKLGQFLAMYGATEFARAEDLWAFLADGSATYEQVNGISQVCQENGKSVTLAAGKTKPSDTTMDDFRAMRSKVRAAALNGAAYYMSQTWEAKLRTYNNNLNDPYVFIYRQDGTPLLDGFPIVWTEVLQAYGTAAAASKCLAAFGRLKYWWFGEHSTPRIDVSEHVYFQNDQLATRFIEEIDFDYNDLAAMSVLLTPAG